MPARLRWFLALVLGLSAISGTAMATNVPSPPSNLHLSQLSFTWVEFIWDPPPTGGTAAPRYDVRIEPGGWQATALSANKSFGGLQAGTTYEASVRTIDATGNLSTPTTLTFTTRPRVGPPPSTPTNLRVTTLNGHADSLVWDPSQHTSPVMYWVYAGTEVVTATTEPHIKVSDLVEIHCLEPGSTYSFEVQAIDYDNYQSAHSAQLTFTIPAL
ncbi:fibronectin type III domain-containing protein [Kribbella sp. NBC_01505]|uniref:fibronectin type III domain-containing protein n=1 Tax=Kribbella sp. NBC_01505 TaxID=2903580 RepID=UPI00386A2FDD